MPFDLTVGVAVVLASGVVGMHPETSETPACAGVSDGCAPWDSNPEPMD